jgi:RNA polymerase sigma factor (sigma-70 family)
MSAVSGSETQRALVAPGRPPLAVPRRILRLRSDAALAERFSAGDEAAFDVLYERHRPVVLAVAMGVLGTTQDAEDATQETFSALAVALHTRPPAELRPWLIRVARNASIDTTRRRRHRLLTLDGELPDIPARSPSVGQAELAVVLDGIRELPEGQRMALLMRELGGHSYSEIAAFLETDEEAVKGLIARARVGLRTYREATDLPCATARAAIASEPDGRRHDKTIRRHLRGCASCRSYRGALRNDAKALRAALPLPAGSVATGGISSGMLTAAKGTLIGYGLTQAATTCAAAACGVGAIGGMVFVAPIHKLGLPPIIAATKVAPAHKHTVVKTAGKTRHAAVLPTYRSTPAVTPAVRPAVTPAITTAVTASRRAVAHVPAVQRSTHFQRHATRFTKVKLPPLHTRGAASRPPSSAGTNGSPQHASKATAPGTIVPPAGNSGGGNGNGYGHQSGPPAPGSAGAPTQGATPPSANGQSGWGTSNSNAHQQGNGFTHGGGPGIAGADNAQAANAGQSSGGASTWPSSGSTGASSTVATSPGGHGHGHSWGDQNTAAGQAGQNYSGQGYSGHGGGWGHGGSNQAYSGQGYSGQGYSGHGGGWGHGGSGHGGSSHGGGWGH